MPPSKETHTLDEREHRLIGGRKRFSSVSSAMPTAYHTTIRCLHLYSAPRSQHFRFWVRQPPDSLYELALAILREGILLCLEAEIVTKHTRQHAEHKQIATNQRLAVDFSQEQQATNCQRKGIVQGTDKALAIVRQGGRTETVTY